MIEWELAIVIRKNDVDTVLDYVRDIFPHGYLDGHGPDTRCFCAPLYEHEALQVKDGKIAGMSEIIAEKVCLEKIFTC